MPHIEINLNCELTDKNIIEIIDNVENSMRSTCLFNPLEIKARCHKYAAGKTAGKYEKRHIYIKLSIMKGREESQRRMLLDTVASGIRHIKFLTGYEICCEIHEIIPDNYLKIWP